MNRRAWTRPRLRVDCLQTKSSEGRVRRSAYLSSRFESVAVEQVGRRHSHRARATRVCRALSSPVDLAPRPLVKGVSHKCCSSLLARRGSTESWRRTASFAGIRVTRRNSSVVETHGSTCWFARDPRTSELEGRFVSERRAVRTMLPRSASWVFAGRI